MRSILTPQGQARPKQRQAPVHRAAEWYRGFQRFLLGNRSLRPFADLLGGEALLSASDGEVLKRHYQAMGFLHRKRDPGPQNTLCQVLRAYGAPLSDTPIPDPQVLETLRREGIARLPALPQARLETLRAYFDPLDLVPPDALQRASHLTEPRPTEHLRRTENLGHVPRNRMLRMPGILDLVTDKDLLALVQSYLEAPAFLTDVSAWRSFAGEGETKPAKDAQLFHVDLDNYRFCKIFIYLSDVDEAAGPHVFVPTTHRPDVINARRIALPDNQQPSFDVWYHETLRKSDEDVKAWINLEPTPILGPAGTCFIADTSGLHRGTPPALEDRWVLQLVYGVTPANSWIDAATPAVFYDWNGVPERKTGKSLHPVLEMLIPGA